MSGVAPTPRSCGGKECVPGLRSGHNADVVLLSQNSGQVMDMLS